MNKSPVLPRYSKDVDSQPETSALLKHSRSVSDLESQIPNIPADEGGAKVEVTLTFVPRWPVVGEEQHALGMLGWTRHVSTTPRTALLHLSKNPRRTSVTGFAPSIIAIIYVSYYSHLLTIAGDSNYRPEVLRCTR